MNLNNLCNNFIKICMFEYIKKIIAIQKNAQTGGIVLRRRLFLYLSLMAAALFASTLLLLFTVYIVYPDSKTEQDLSNDLDRYAEHLSTHFGNTAAQGIHLSTRAAKEVERTLAEHGASFDAVSDNPRLIAALERNTFDIVRNALLITNCSGAFIIFDATVNTSLPDSKNSRSGLYLKLANINVSKPVNPEMLWTRGTHEVGLENKLIFHNKWELEFAMNRIPFYRVFLENTSKNLMDSYYYAPVMRLHGTWERILLLLVPIVGKNGVVYGVCGFEISGLFFKLMHPVSEDRGRRLTGLVAQKQGDVILTESGLESGTASGYFADLGNGELRFKQAGELTRYMLTGGREFVGAHKEIVLSPLSKKDAKPWVVACFMPKEEYDSVIAKNYIKILLCCLVFLSIAVTLCWVINNRCISPLVEGIGAIKTGVSHRTNIQEIDDLLEFMSGNDIEKDEVRNDVDMSTFYTFKENISKLSRAEKSVFDLYMEGHSAQEITEILHISINTIKTHNRNIFRKLNVSSRKALMIYVQMMQRAQK